jgi:cyclopropane-fatty-acyl-phospholipid synthase
MANAKQVVLELLDSADIHVDGIRPQDIKINNNKFYSRVLSGGSLALGESYMDGWWDANSLDVLIFKILETRLDVRVKGNIKNKIVPYLKSKFLNMQKSHAYHIGQWHYDIGNDLYAAMLDDNMQYSCGYWKNATNLDKAQLDKMDLICRKLQLKEGETLLDIGCGWGGLLKYAASNYGIKGVGVTVSKEQADFARKNCEGLPIDIRFQDYRKISEQFDKIVSVGMIEHVGYKNYREYMKIVNRCLKDGGLFLLHTIGSNTTTTGPGDPWNNKYIFPNGKLPSGQQLLKASEKYFVMEDWHNFGADYDKTLMAWSENFNKEWPRLKEMDTIKVWKEHFIKSMPKLKDKADEVFYRMWNYYLSGCAAAFRLRNIQLWQIVYSKDGILGGYQRKD